MLQFGQRSAANEDKQILPAPIRYGLFVIKRKRGGWTKSRSAIAPLGAGKSFHQLGSLIIFYPNEFHAVPEAIAVVHLRGDDHTRFAVSLDQFHGHVVAGIEFRGNVNRDTTFADVIALAIHGFKLRTHGETHANATVDLHTLPASLTRRLRDTSCRLTDLEKKVKGATDPLGVRQ